MDQQDISIFKELMTQVLMKATGKSLHKMTIGEFEEVAFKIEETLDNSGIGARSLKNYTRYLVDQKYDKINPNLSTLNGLVQYLWEADTPDGLWLEFRKQSITESNTFFPANKKIILVGTTFLLAALLVGILIYNFQKRQFRPLQYNFTHSDLSLLNKDGWFLFPDSVDLRLWNDSVTQTSGLLNLKTHLGGPWLENRDFSPKTINILAHPIQCGECCEIQVKLVAFNPYQRYQQAGFFLFYSESEIPSISFIFACGGGTNHIQAVRRDGEYANEHLIPFEQYKSRAKVSDIFLNPDTKKYEPRVAVDSTILKLVVQGSHYFFLYKTDQNEFKPVASKKIEFGRPISIGLTAFQGRPDVPTPVFPVADVIEAKFEYVTITKCK